MACSNCENTGKVCVVCDQSKADCNCTEDDIKEYIEEEEVDTDLFEQFIDCIECDGEE